jgi:hypothetical protein
MSFGNGAAGLCMTPSPFTPLLTELKDAVEKYACDTFDTVSTYAPWEKGYFGAKQPCAKPALPLLWRLCHLCGSETLLREQQWCEAQDAKLFHRQATVCHTYANYTMLLNCYIMQVLLNYYRDGSGNNMVCMSVHTCLYATITVMHPFHSHCLNLPF